MVEENKWVPALDKYYKDRIGIPESHQTNHEMQVRQELLNDTKTSKAGLYRCSTVAKVGIGDIYTNEEAPR